MSGDVEGSTSRSNDDEGSARSTKPLLTLRASVVLLLAVVVGVGSGALSYLVQHSVAEAVLCGGGATGAALVLFNSIIGT
jgi:hypothetical protein